MTAIVRKAVRLLKDAGNPVTSVFDGERQVPVTNEKELMAIVNDLDEGHLCTSNPEGWVLFVTCNPDPEDQIADHTTNLEDALKPLFDSFR